MTWPEEITLLTGDYGPCFPRSQLLANAKMFYFYDFETDSLFRAGNTLEEVYQGLSQRRWSFNPRGTAERWVLEPDCGSEEYDRYDYFPIWKHAEENNDGDTYVLADPLLPFIPQNVVFDNDSGDKPGISSEGK